MKKKINIRRKGISFGLLLAEPWPDVHLHSPPQGKANWSPEEARLQARHKGQSGLSHQPGRAKPHREWRACLAPAPVHSVRTAWPWLWVDGVAGGCFMVLRWSPGG